MMNRVKLGCFFCILFLYSDPTVAQECDVLINGLAGEYSGECKRGLAHGDGMATGNKVKYEGEFRKGYPHGEGTLTFDDGRIYKGEWKNGQIYGYGKLTSPDLDTKEGYFKGSINSFRYMGDTKSSLLGYEITETQRLDNATVNFVNSDPEGNGINIKIFENNIREITNFEILEMTDGVIQLMTNSGGRLNAEIEMVKFPVIMGIRYIIPYGTQDTTLPGGLDNLNSPRILRFKIMEPGDWTVTITHR